MPLQTVLVLLLALVALVLWPLYLLAFRDRWRGWGWTMYFCLSWGIIAAPLLTLALGIGVFTPERFPLLTSDLAATGFLGPVMEEVLKGLALVGVVVTVRLRKGASSLEIPTLALLGGTVGFGFAFTEAFLSAWPLGQAGGAFDGVTFGVEIVTGYLHVATSALLGGAVGWTIDQRWAHAIGAGVAAVGLHVLNNSMVVLGQGLGLGFIAFLVLSATLLVSRRLRTQTLSSLRQLLKALLPFYMPLSASVVAIAIALATASALGNQVGSFIESFSGLWNLVGLAAGLVLIFLIPGFALVIMYEIEEVYLAWDEISPGEEQRFLIAHALRDWVQDER